MLTQSKITYPLPRLDPRPEDDGQTSLARSSAFPSARSCRTEFGWAPAGQSPYAIVRVREATARFAVVPMSGRQS